MKKNIFLEIEYDGTDFYGSQIQNRRQVNGQTVSEPTIQSKLEQALEKLFNCPVRVVLAGRTDRGVHARGQGVSFSLDTKIPLPNIKQALNTFLPDSIRVRKIKKVPADFHARFSARYKTYCYRIFNNPEPSVFERHRSWFVPQELSMGKMEKCSRLLIGEKDFRLFAREASAYHDCRRTIYEIKFGKKGGCIVIKFRGNGFLRCMVRNIVSFLVRAGCGEISLPQARCIVRGKSRYINHPAPAGGLYLHKVTY